MAGNVKRFSKNKGYESIDRCMLQDEENLSLEAIGLLSNLVSYPDTWVLHKTELYKRFTKSKRNKVESAWNNLVEEKYIVQLRKRNGKKYDYLYYFATERFTDEEIQELSRQEQADIWDGKVSKNKVEEIKENQSATVNNWTVDFQQSNLDSSKPTDKRYTTKKLTINNTLDTLDTKNEIFRKAYLNNKDKIPKRLAETLHALTQSEIEIEEHYRIIIIAKSLLEKNLGVPLFFEEDEELLSATIQGYANAVRKIEKGSPGDFTKIENKEGYIFTSIMNQLQTLTRDRFPYKSIEIGDSMQSIFLDYFNQ